MTESVREAGTMMRSEADSRTEPNGETESISEAVTVMTSGADSRTEPNTGLNQGIGKSCQVVIEWISGDWNDE